MEGAFVCAALQDQYKIYDYNNGAVQDLFPFDSEHLQPIITQISRVSLWIYLYGTNWYASQNLFNYACQKQSIWMPSWRDGVVNDFVLIKWILTDCNGRLSVLGYYWISLRMFSLYPAYQYVQLKITIFINGLLVSSYAVYPCVETHNNDRLLTIHGRFVILSAPNKTMYTIIIFK